MGSKYDVWAAAVQAALATPEGVPREGPAAALLRSLEGFIKPPTGALPRNGECTRKADNGTLSAINRLGLQNLDVISFRKGAGAGMILHGPERFGHPVPSE